MKILVALAVLTIGLAGICGGGVLTGILPVESGATATSVQAVPPLQPLPTEATDNADMVVTLSERYLNRQLLEGLGQGGEVSNVQLDLHAGQAADVTAQVRMNSSITLRPKAALKLTVNNGRVGISVQKVDVGGVGVPNNIIEPQIAELQRTAETELNRQLGSLQQNSGLRLSALASTENSLILYFSR